MEDAATDTTWESFVRNVISHLIAALPNIIRNGYQKGGVSIEPYKVADLPDLSLFDTRQKLALCPILYTLADTTKLSLSQSKLSGLDNLDAYGPASFPVQDVTMEVPLIFPETTLIGNWETHSLCQKGSAAPVDTVHDGTFIVRFLDAQVTLIIELDSDAGAAKSVTVQLTDSNNKWTQQPTFDPATDLTFDSKATTGQKTVLGALLHSDDTRSKFRDAVKTNVIDSEQTANNLKDLINQMLDQI